MMYLCSININIMLIFIVFFIRYLKTSLSFFHFSYFKKKNLVDIYLGLFFYLGENYDWKEVHYCTSRSDRYVSWSINFSWNRGVFSALNHLTRVILSRITSDKNLSLLPTSQRVLSELEKISSICELNFLMYCFMEAA